MYQDIYPNIWGLLLQYLFTYGSMVERLADTCSIKSNIYEEKESYYTNTFAQSPLKDDEEVYTKLPGGLYIN